MTSEELQKLVIDLIDQHSMELSLSDFADAMREISQETESRARAAEIDLERQKETE